MLKNIQGNNVLPAAVTVSPVVIYSCCYVGAGQGQDQEMRMDENKQLDLPSRAIHVSVRVPGHSSALDRSQDMWQHACMLHGRHGRCTRGNARIGKDKSMVVVIISSSD